MTPEEFFDKFDTFAELPGAINKLRELILRWAVDGNLTTQENTDESADKLLKAAIAEREKLIEEGILRKQDIDIEEYLKQPSDLPVGWLRAPLAIYTGVIMGQSPPSSAYNDNGVGLPFYQGKAQFGDLYPTATHWCDDPTKIGEAGDVLLSVRAPVGPTNLLREQSCIGRGLAALRSLCGDQMHMLYSLRAYESVLAGMGFGSTFVAITKKHVDQFEIPIPPLAEQKRIVAKVDALMALVDRLEDRQRDAHDLGQRLLTAAIAELAQPQKTTPNPTKG